MVAVTPGGVGGQEPQGSPKPAKRTVLTLLPERMAFGHSVRSGLAAQYWGVPVVTASVPDGLLPGGPSEPAPLPLTLYTGTIRPQLILAAQAVKVPGLPSLPGLPSYCAEQGGLVSVRAALKHPANGSQWGCCGLGSGVLSPGTADPIPRPGDGVHVSRASRRVLVME